MKRFSEYRIMWILVFFDLPTATKQDKRAYQNFRDYLERDGFTMFQFSIYLRHCASKENAEVHQRRLRANLPPHGKVSVLCITDRQFEKMEIFYGAESQTPNFPGLQLEFF